MTEPDWSNATDPGPMLAFLRDRASDRKLRLFAVACCRRAWPLLTDGRSRRAVEVAERYADDETDDESLRLAAIGAVNVADAFAASSATAAQEAQASAAFAAFNTTITATKAADYSAANVGSAAFHAATADGALSAARSRDTERAAQARLLRDIFGPLPLRRVPIASSVRTWNDGTVVRLARAIYETRSLPDGMLDNARFAVLADALEEASCDNEDILSHCRSPRDHVRGCWILDLLLGKE